MTIFEYKRWPKIQNLLKEIGERVEPYIKKSDINLIDVDDQDYYDGAKFTFKDEVGNEIKVIFIEMNNPGEYEVEFMVNGDSYQSFKTSTTHYFKILSTIIEVINKFMDEYDPFILKVDGIDTSVNKQGQKNDIYMAYAKANIENGSYRIARLKKGFVLSK